MEHQRLVTIYRTRARRYDLSAKLYYLAGFRQMGYRKQAIRALNLARGATVVDIGCGTGLNFPFLQQMIGPQGKIIGVDLTDAMLEQAQRRVTEHGWTNVELVQRDAAAFTFPAGIDGIISTFALTLVPEYAAIIRNGAQALASGGRWVVLDFKLPSNWLARFAPLLAMTFVRPFGGTLEMAERHPWEAMQQYLTRVTVTDLYGGFAYIAVGEGSSTNGCATSP